MELVISTLCSFVFVLSSFAALHNVINKRAWFWWACLSGLSFAVIINLLLIVNT
jgi:hypothetical protein